MQSIVILGGGTAGWITANLFALNWGDRDIDITLVESPDIGIIGVVEGAPISSRTASRRSSACVSRGLPCCPCTATNRRSDTALNA